MSFKILGTGHFMPQRIVDNNELSTIVDTSDEWIVKRIGVKQRHVCTTESTADLGEQAALLALENAGIAPEQLDLIIGTTITADNVTPGLAAIVQKRLGATCPAFDMSVACSGFIFALETAAGFFQRKTVKNVLIVSSERLSGVTDWTDRGTCCIFADGAGAAVLGEGEGYLVSHLDTKGDDEVLLIPIESNKSPFYQRELPPAVVYMNGHETYKYAVTIMPAHIKAVMEQSGISGEQIAWVVPHQANLRIISEACRRVPEIAPEKFCANIENYGNTSSASVPILLDELNRSGKLKRGDYIILVAFGGGLSSGACILQW